MPNSKGKLVKEISKHKPVWLPFPDARRQERFDAIVKVRKNKGKNRKYHSEGGMTFFIKIKG